MARSINQNAYSSALPNFRNLGVLLRVLVFVNVVALAAAVVKTDGWRGLWPELLETSALVQPLLILSLLALVAAERLAAAPAGLPGFPGGDRAGARADGVPAQARAVRCSSRSRRRWRATACWCCWSRRRCSCTSACASGRCPRRSRRRRLQALQARIRPHFLYNSINAVLSLIRQNPKRAEEVLEDMAELFRVLMADNRELTTLEREIELCRRYLDLEQLRLGDRLKAEWLIERVPRGALVPPLVLQPLIENAVYHGIEPRVEPGVISIHIYGTRDRVHAVLRNPYLGEGDRHEGNKMALANIRERLQLHFDAEASLTTSVQRRDLRSAYRDAVPQGRGDRRVRGEGWRVTGEQCIGELVFERDGADE